MDFGDRFEVTCPCCSEYKHSIESELEKISHRRLSKREVVCEECWRVFKRLQKMEIERIARTAYKPSRAN